MDKVLRTFVANKRYLLAAVDDPSTALKALLAGSPFMQSCGCRVAKQSAKISRLLKRFHL